MTAIEAVGLNVLSGWIGGEIEKVCRWWNKRTKGGSVDVGRLMAYKDSKPWPLESLRG